MAKLVLGIGTSHTPMLTLESHEWEHRAAADYENPSLNLSDGRRVNYSELLAEVGPRHRDVATVEELARQAEICESALDRLRATLLAVDPDVVIVVGDDQEELFTTGNNPALAIFYGAEIKTSDKYGRPGLPTWMHTLSVGYGMDRVHVFPGAPDFASELIVGLTDRHIEVAACARVDNSPLSGFGHAFGFVIRRLFNGHAIPVIPVLLNTYYPPNVPTAARCHDIGKVLRKIIDLNRSDTRVAIIASGGLSHFVVDEELDRRVLEGLKPGSQELLRSIPRHALNSGSSEILNWVLMAGALGDLRQQWLEYQPIYRTPAGTGVGVAFGSWTED
jgi:hypothetical protein